MCRSQGLDEKKMNSALGTGIQYMDMKGLFYDKKI